GGERRVAIDSLENIVLEIGLGLDEFFAEYLREVCSPHLVTKSGHGEDPQLILRALRGGKDPDLGWIGEIPPDRVSPLRPGQSFPIHATAGRLDDAREFDRHAALVDAEAWLRSLVRRTEYRRLSPEETSHLCTALGVWASIQRALGHHARGVKALELAWRLHGEVLSAPSCGDLLERTSMAVYEHGFPVLATPFMQRALAVANQWEDQRREIKALLGCAILAFRSGEHSLTVKICTRILKHPGADTIRKTGATSFLALAYEQVEELEKAAECLRQATFVDEPGLPPLARLSLLGLRARLLKSLGNLEPARALYEKILEASRPHASPRYRGFVLLHLAEILVELNDPSFAERLSREVESLVSELEDTPASRAIMAGLLSALRRGEQPTSRSITEMRAQLEKLS
ncbi:MAG: hypothetical protein AAGF23_19730, partial [Acidobacteriota bacterium]